MTLTDLHKALDIICKGRVGGTVHTYDGELKLFPEHPEQFSEKEVNDLEKLRFRRDNEDGSFYAFT